MPAVYRIGNFSHQWSSLTQLHRDMETRRRGRMTVRGHGGRVGGSPYWVQVWAVGFLPEHAWRLLNCMSLTITGFYL